MKVVGAAYQSYTARPTWTLTLECGHFFNYTAPADCVHSLAKPPTDFDCALCAGEKTNQPTEDMSDKIKSEIGMQAMFNCILHVCVEATDKRSVWYAKNCKYIEDASEPFGYRCHHRFIEKSHIAEVLTKDVGSHELFKAMTEAQIKTFLASNAVKMEPQTIGETKNQTTKENSMATKKLTAEQKAVNKAARAAKTTAKPTKKPAKAKAAAKSVKTEKSANATTGTRTKIFGNSAYKIAVTLGSKGVTEERAVAIIRKQGSNLAGATIKGNFYLGRSGKGNAATLTDEQLDELLKSVA